MGKTVTIEKLDSGYVVRGERQYGSPASCAATALEDALRQVLYYLEGRCPSMGGRFYGDVKVFLEKGSKRKADEDEPMVQELDPMVKQAFIKGLRLGHLEAVSPCGYGPRASDDVLFDDWLKSVHQIQDSRLGDHNED